MTRRLAPWLLLAAFLAVYLPDVGHGFLRDDFSWIRDSRIGAPADGVRLFRQDNGFFRPLVSVSFAVDHALYGLRPFAFASTNVALLLLAAAVLYHLARALGLERGPALLAAAVWAFNLHGVPMALLWISGRTSILLTLLSLLAALAVVRGRPLAAGAACLAALLAKEEAVMLPFILLSWIALAAEGPVRERAKAAGRAAWPSCAMLVPYFVLRSGTRAYLPHDAPGFYRWTFDPALLARNALEYADRSCTIALVIVLLTWLVVRRRPRLTSPEARVVRRGLVWLVLGFALTVFVPVRSSLYALFPSVGSALAAAAVAQALWRRASPPAVRWVPAAALLLPLLALPAYRARARRWVDPADVSAHVLATLGARPPASGVVTVLVDTPDRRLASAFGTLFPEARELYGLGRVLIEPPPPGSSDPPPSPGETIDRLFLKSGRLVNQLE